MMTLEELKKFLNSLPERFNGYGIVNGEVGTLPSENEEDEDGDVVYRCDKPIVTLYVDENSKEVCLFHQTDKEVKNIAGENYFDDGTPEEDKSEDVK